MYNNISLEQIKKISSLAKISFSDNDLKLMMNELNGVLHWVEKIHEVNTDEVEPLLSPNKNNLVLMDDIVEHQEIRSEILKNAPKEKHSYLVTPKAVDGA